MTEKGKAWALILFLLLPILLEEICRQSPESYYCRCVGHYLRDPEPITETEQAFKFSAPYYIVTSSATVGSTTMTTTL